MDLWTTLNLSIKREQVEFEMCWTARSMARMIMSKYGTRLNLRNARSTIASVTCGYAPCVCQRKLNASFVHFQEIGKLESWIIPPYRCELPHLWADLNGLRSSLSGLNLPRMWSQPSMALRTRFTSWYQSEELAHTTYMCISVKHFYIFGQNMALTA